MAEIYAGDYTPDDNITAKEKQKKELIGIKRVADELGEGDLVDLFNEFTDQSSKEALFVNALDKIELVNLISDLVFILVVKVICVFNDKNKLSSF